MREKMKKSLYILITAAVMLGGLRVSMTVRAQEIEQQAEVSRAAEETGVTVTTREDFMEALEQNASVITVKEVISIGAKDSEDNNSMEPVMIPGNTVIQGAEGGSISCRSPIQLKGDGVTFKNIELNFTSSDSIGSVPHREIFLAGHTLVLDNVDTYSERAGGDLGPIGGTGEQLPTVYAGGYSNTGIGDNASLTIENSNSETMFQAIYMGHGEDADNKVAYRGNALLNLDAGATICDEIVTDKNSNAQVNVTGNQKDRVKGISFSGNKNTTLTVEQITMEEAEVSSVGNIVLKDGASMSPASQSLQNVALKRDSCLDLKAAMDVVISGDFAGEENSGVNPGVLVLHPEGVLKINGYVTGTTQFQTDSRTMPGKIIAGKSYISSNSGGGTETSFVLAQKHIDDGFGLRFVNNEWVVYSEIAESLAIEKIQIVSAPEKVDLRKIIRREDGSIPDENAYFEVKWINRKNKEITSEKVIEYGFSEPYYVILIPTDDWENENIDSSKILEPLISLIEPKEPPVKYYLQAEEGALPGDYTFLFCSEDFMDNLSATEEIEELKAIVKAEQRVIFYNQDTTEPEVPDHTHQYQSVITKEPTCTDKGVKTFTCACGDKYTESIATTNHKYNSEITQQPSCIKEGVKTYICSFCKDMYTEKIAMVEHTEVKDPAIAPTDTEEGKTEGSHCSVCGTVLKKQETIPATGSSNEPEHTHKYQSTITKQATCQAKGTRTYTCECGHKYTEEIALLSHRYTEKRTPATVNSDGKVQQLCSVCGSVKNTTVIYRPGKLTWNKADFSYDGKVKKPSAIVVDITGKRLTAGTDYQVKYPKGCKNPGVYSVTVEFRGNYSGKMTGSFTIRPKKTSLKKVTAKSKGMQVSWKKQAAQMDGYQIQYGTSGNFKGKSVKTVTAKKNITSKKISKLSRKKKYYVRIRTYKTVKVNGKNKKLYSDWSGKKTVVTKK